MTAEINWQERALAAESKLAEIERQSPYGYVPNNTKSQFDNFGYARIDKKETDFAVIPLYASPAQQSQELTDITSRRWSKETEFFGSGVTQYPFVKLTESQILTKMHPQPIYPSEFNSGKQLKIKWADVEIQETGNTVAAEMPLKIESAQHTPSDAQLEQIFNGIGGGFFDESRREFLRVWIRDWTIHKLEKLQRITEQDAREILWAAARKNPLTQHEIGLFLSSQEGKAVLAKLNEHREPDYKAQRDELIEILSDIQSVISESRGIIGYHLNGDVALWDEFDCFRNIPAVIAKREGGK